MMAHIEMKAMEKFPIERLSHDLKSELLENMDPSDVVELGNVNQGFRSIVVREPWRIFGKQVGYIWIRPDSPGQQIYIRKLDSWVSMNRDNEVSLKLSGVPSHSMGPKTFSNLIAKIRSCSCQSLRFSLISMDQGQEAAQLTAKLLANIDSVRGLNISIDDAKANIEKYLTLLTPNHIDRATFDILLHEGNEPKPRALLSFVETSLNHCKTIEIRDDSKHYSSWYEPLSTIWTQMILIKIPPPNWSMGVLDFEKFVHRIVNMGIPGSNPEVAILLSNCNYSRRADYSITDFLAQTAGVRQIAHGDRGELLEILEKSTVDELIPENYIIRVDQFEKFLREGIYFTRSIDSNRKCIYVTNPAESHFFAKYVTIG